MFQALPKTGTWIVSYKLKRNVINNHVDCEALSGTGGHIVFSYFSDMHGTYTWRDGQSVRYFSNSLPSAGDWHTVAYSFDMDNKIYATSYNDR